VVEEEEEDEEEEEEVGEADSQTTEMVMGSTHC